MKINFKDFKKTENNTTELPVSDEIIKLPNNKYSEHSFKIENYLEVLKYLCDQSTKSIRLNDINLSNFLRLEFTEIFGKHNCTFRGEFLHYIWIVSFKNEVFEIFTSKRGTTYQIVGKYSDRKSKVCIEFLKKLNKIMNDKFKISFKKGKFIEVDIEKYKKSCEKHTKIEKQHLPNNDYYKKYFRDQEIENNLFISKLEKENPIITFVHKSKKYLDIKFSDGSEYGMNMIDVKKCY